MKNETPFEEFAWYINFQAAVLKQLPRPDEIDQVTALGWERNQKALKKNLAGALLPPKWKERDGVFYLDVYTDGGANGRMWDYRLKRKGYNLEMETSDLLYSEGFEVTSKMVLKSQIAILKNIPVEYFTKHICDFAIKGGLLIPKTDIACLLREKLTDDDLENMGLRDIAVMHDPIIKSNGGSRILGVSRRDKGNLLDVYCGGGDTCWRPVTTGFAFVVSHEFIV